MRIRMIFYDRSEELLPGKNSRKRVFAKSEANKY